MKATESGYWVPMLGHAFAILQLFFQPGVELSLPQIGARTGITKTSVYRIVFTLTELGYLERTAEGNVRLGRKLFEASGRARAGLALPALARPLMVALRDRFGETVNLAALQGSEIVYIDIVEGSHAFRLSSAVGSIAPMHAAAVAKAILAELALDERERLLAGRRLTRLTPRTLTTRTQVLDEAQSTVARGYAVDDEEIEPQAVCLAVALPGDGVGGPYALSLAGPGQRMHAHKNAIVAALKDTRKALVARL